MRVSAVWQAGVASLVNSFKKIKYLCSMMTVTAPAFGEKNKKMACYVKACLDCTRQLLSSFWRLKQLFAILVKALKILVFLSNFCTEYRFRAHVKYKRVNDIHLCKFFVYQPS